MTTSQIEKKHSISSSNKHNISIQALEVIYYVVIGVTITDALKKVFVKNETFRGFTAILEPANIVPFFLLLALLFTICRFVHGATMYLHTTTKKRYKPLMDFIAFCLHALFFYLMAHSLESPVVFSYLFVIMVGIDAAWLALLKITRYTQPARRPDIQWFISDICLVVVLLLLLGLSAIYHLSTICLAINILIIAFVATLFDYYLNKEFYFPISQSQEKAAEMAKCPKCGAELKLE